MENPLLENQTECSFCFARFSHKSSLVRHLKNNCNQPSRQSNRRRSCRQCVSKKVRCSLKRPTCSRCGLRNINCDYPMDQGEQIASFSVDSEICRSSSPSRTDTVNLSLQELRVHSTTELQDRQSSLDASLFESLFSTTSTWKSTPSTNLALCASNISSSISGAENIITNNEQTETHNLLVFEKFTLPFSPPQSPAENVPFALAKHSMELIFRVLRTWPKMLAEEFQAPPLFHAAQLTPGMKLPLPLATCITLTKMWNGTCEGAEDLVRKIILQELGNLVDHDQSESLEGGELIAVLQAVVIYAIMLISPSNHSKSPLPDHNEIFRKIELLIYRIVHNGLFLQEERDQKRPTWAEWIDVTSKRRAVLSLYLLHWAYSVLYRVPCFDCADLGFMPAPAPKVLWQATTEREWDTRYIQWLGRWSGKLYLQAELGWIKPGAVMNARAERWLEETDEFGFIMISIVNAADYDPPGLKALAL